MNIFLKHSILLECVILVGCASHPQQTTQSQRDMIPLPKVATCPNPPTFQNVMTILREHGLHPSANISGTTGKITIYVYPGESAKAREILSTVANDDKVKDLEVLK